jgi:sugar-specific transcriptional regulator TrmB
MGQNYADFKHNYQSTLLESQREMLEKINELLFSKLENGFINDYFPVLVRMPTGTGKTGVIAISAYFGNNNGSTLILTPWKHLCDQLIEDLKNEFWNNINYQDRLNNIFVPIRFYPSTIEKFLQNNDSRKIFVGSLSGLQTLQRKNIDLYNKLAEQISLVIVDEGHYEPAVLWGRSVKQLNRPTLILTATPYRNDLKLFRVPKDHFFQYTHEKAVKASKLPIRKVESFQMNNSSDKFKELISEFISHWEQLKDELPIINPRAIICCDNKTQVMDALEIVNLGHNDHKITALAFHERVEDEDFQNKYELQSLFIKDVPRAKDTSEEIWIHQNKLTEGVDDPRFIVLLLAYPLKNDRKLVQQVGRILRHCSNEKIGKKNEQKAIVFYCSDYPFPEIWENYLEFEKLTDVVTGDHYRDVITSYLDLQPEYEYFDKRFRKRLEPFSKINSIEWENEARVSILTLPRASVFFINDDFDLADFVEATTDSILLHDGVILNSQSNDAPSIYDDNGPVLWLYAHFKNPRILIKRSAYEISIEIRVIHLIGRYLFIADSSGTTSGDYLDKFAKKITYFDIARALDDDYVIRQVSLFNTQSLNTSVRRTIRQGSNLSDAPYQISEAKYVCQNLRAKKDQFGERYFGLSTGRISDRISSDKRVGFNLKQFTDWVEVIATLFDQTHDKNHDFLSRYAKISQAPSNAIPYSLIIDIFNNIIDSQFENPNTDTDIDDDNILWQIIESNEYVDIEYSVIEFTANNDEEWPYSLQIEAKSAKVVIKAKYDQEKCRFKFKKGDKSEIRVKFKNDVITVVDLLNKCHDRYVITLKDPKLVYHNHQYFVIDYKMVEEKFACYINKVDFLKEVSYEKISTEINEDPGKKGQLLAWPDESVFYKTITNVIPTYFPHYDWLYCDDPNSEIADFIVADFDNRKIAFIHCKYGGGSILSVSKFHDLCSQASKNLVYLRTTRIPPNINKWNRDAFWEKTKIKRWLKGEEYLPENEKMWEKIKLEILDHPRGEVEIWLVLGNGLDVDNLNRVIKSDKETHEVGPLLHLLDGLVANCSEAAVKLSIIAH